MDGLFPLFPSTKDSLRGRHLHLSSLAGSRSHVNVEGAGPISPEPELSAPQKEAEEFNEMEEEEEEEKGEEEEEKVQGNRRQLLNMAVTLMGYNEI